MAAVRWMKAAGSVEMKGGPQVLRGPRCSEFPGPGWFHCTWRSDAADPGGWPIRYGWQEEPPTWATPEQLASVEPKFYIQDTRQVVGNCALWRKKGQGYTLDLDDAWLVDEATGKAHGCRETDVLVPQWMAEEASHRHASLDTLGRLKIEEEKVKLCEATSHEWERDRFKGRDVPNWQLCTRCGQRREG